MVTEGRGRIMRRVPSTPPCGVRSPARPGQAGLVPRRHPGRKERASLVGCSIVYEFRGGRESAAWWGIRGCDRASWCPEVTASEWHEITGMSNITYVEVISNGGNYFES